MIGMNDKNAVLEAACELFLDRAAVPYEEEETAQAEPGRSLDKKIKKLSAKTGDGQRRRIPAAVRNAGIAAALIAVLCVSAYAIDPVWTSLKNFSVSISEKYSEFVYKGKAIRADISPITPEFIPERFSFKKGTNGYSKEFYYVDEATGDFLSLTFSSRKYASSFETENGASSEVEVGGEWCFYVDKDEEQIYIWEHDGVACSLFGEVSREEAVRIISAISY